MARIEKNFSAGKDGEVVHRDGKGRMGFKGRKAPGRKGHGSTISVEELQVGPYLVQLTRKNIKRAYLRLDDAEGPVRVSAPTSMALTDILAFVEKQVPWIESRRKLLSQELPASPRRGHISDDGTVLLWGRPVPLAEVSPKAAVLLDTPGPEAPQRAEKALVTELHRRLDDVAHPLVEHHAARMGVHVSELRYRDMQTRWGTCNVRDHRIWLAVSLAHFPKECTELIVVHELSHLIEAGHGPRFKACMDLYLPDWRDREALLKRASRGR